MLNSSRQRIVARALMLAVVAATVFLITHAGHAVSGMVQKWRMYEDKTYEFSIKYPRQFFVMPEKGAGSDDGSGRLHRVRFQDRKVASWQTADLEPPQFTIEVFKADGAASLKERLQSAQWVNEGDTVEPFEVEGAREGVRVRLMQQLAPNEFYYVATEKYLFRLTPLGPLGPDMLASFRLKAGR
ncbi:MAG TPA: hypothetical protein VGC87_00765 [Pyrinomonadaceae bacterium]